MTNKNGVILGVGENTYKITLNSNLNSDTWPGITNTKFPNGYVVTEIVVEKGKNYPAIPKPTATGYVFKNWYDGTNNTNFPDKDDA